MAWGLSFSTGVDVLEVPHLQYRWGGVEADEGAVEQSADLGEVREAGSPIYARRRGNEPSHVLTNHIIVTDGL